MDITPLPTPLAGLLRATTMAPSVVDDEVHDLQIRLVITIVGSMLSLFGCSVMMFAYRRYQPQLGNTFNDLYVYGLGGFQLLQALQFLVFAVVHVVQLRDFDGVLCITNAVLDQFLDFGAQTFALGFFVSIITFRVRCDCCFASMLLEAERERSGRLSMRGGGVFPAGSHEHYALLGPPGGDASSSTRRSLTSAGQVRQTASGPVVCANTDEYVQQPPSLLSTRNALCDSTIIAKTAWPILACAGASVSAILMCVLVVQDPNQRPIPAVPNPSNFQVTLGWCWIPENHTLLRLFCCYLLSLMTVIAGVIALGVLYHYEHELSFKLHSAIYIRIAAFCGLIVSSYAAGAVSRFSPSHAVSCRCDMVATVVFSSYGFLLSVIFLVTERCLLSVLRRQAYIPLGTNGFASSIHHLLMMEVQGVQLPASSRDASRRVFTATEITSDLLLEGLPSTATSANRRDRGTDGAFDSVVVIRNNSNVV